MCLAPDKDRGGLEAAWEPCRGSGSAVWGCPGVVPVPMGNPPAASITRASTARGCREHRLSGGSSWQVLRAGPRAFQAAQVRESPKPLSTVLPCWLCGMDRRTVLRVQERRP